MKKNLIVAGIALTLILGGGSVFLWQKSQADVQALNKTLPEGVRVTKSFIGNEYRVVNKIDGYEFGVPKAWNGLNTIEYTPEFTEQGYTATILDFDGKEGVGVGAAIDRFKVKEENIDLEQWARKNAETFGFINDEYTQGKIGELDIIKTQENIHLAGLYTYFFQKGNATYALTNASEDYIREIILSGKW